MYIFRVQSFPTVQKALLFAYDIFGKLMLMELGIQRKFYDKLQDLWYEKFKIIKIHLKNPFLGHYNSF